MEDLWNSVLAELQIEVSKPTFLTFFKKTQLLSFEEHIATVSAPTFMMAQHIEQRYSALIKKILDKKTGEGTSVIFTSTTKIPGKTQGKSDTGPLFTQLNQPQKRPSTLRVKQEYQFETLAVSDSNQLAYTAALTVAKDPGKKYNPLFLYGTVGVGKTHLMHAIANKVIKDNTEAKILYLTTEEFTNEVVEAMMNKSMLGIRKKFRHIDLLLLDDIQFLAGKDKVQEELFHTFNALIDAGGQIVFSSDRPPSELKKIEARLASRFEGGLTVDIQPPDTALRSAILLIKSRKYDVPLTPELAGLVADKIEETRALEGFLLKLASFQTAKKDTPITQSVIMSLLGQPKEKNTILHPDSVVDAVCSFYNIKSTQLKGARRDSFLVRPRHICMFLLKEEAHLTLSEIGNLLGGRDHTTVMHGVEKIRTSLELEQRLREEVAYLEKQLISVN